MSATLEHVAAKVNLSTSIVSRVLNGKRNARTSDETRRRIIECARELNYRPNLSARNLSKGKSHAIAFVCDLSADSNAAAASSEMSGLYASPRKVPDLNVRSEAFEVCAEMLNDAGYELKLKLFHDHASALAAVRDMIAASSVDGLILWSPEPEMEEVGLLAEELRFPFVIKGRFESSHPEWPQVDFDHEAMSREAVRFLVEKGRRNLGLICRDSEITYNVRHIEGYRRAIVEEGAAPESAERIYRYPTGSPDPAGMRDFLRKNGPDATVPALDGLVITESPAAAHVEMALMEMDIAIGFGPRDIAAAGAIRPDVSLLAGEAVRFEQLELTAVLERMVNGQLLRILNGESAEEGIVRLSPRLVPVRGLDPEHVRLFGKFAARRFQERGD